MWVVSAPSSSPHGVPRFEQSAWPVVFQSLCCWRNSPRGRSEAATLSLHPGTFERHLPPHGSIAVFEASSSRFPHAVLPKLHVPASPAWHRFPVSYPLGHSRATSLSLKILPVIELMSEEMGSWPPGTLRLTGGHRKAVGWPVWGRHVGPDCLNSHTGSRRASRFFSRFSNSLALLLFFLFFKMLDAELDICFFGLTDAFPPLRLFLV